MSDLPSKQPDNSPTAKQDKSDPGDETIRHFRYQFAYGVILLIKNALEHIENTEVISFPRLWCEQRDDFLCQGFDRVYDAYQVKSNESEQNPWKLSDEDLWKSLKRFVNLKVAFPKARWRFHFVSNTKVSQSTSKRHGHLSPSRLVEAIKKEENWEQVNDSAKKGFALLRKKIEASHEDLEAVLKNLNFVLGPTYRGFEDEIAQTHIAKLPQCCNLNPQKLSRICDALIQKVAEASSLYSNDPAKHYPWFHDSETCDPFLMAKCITVEDVHLTIRGVIDGQFQYLESLSSIKLGSAGENLNRLQEKMLHGGLIHHYDMMRRRALSAESALLDLATRPDAGVQVLSQLENVVMGVCDDERLRASQSPEPFGTKMLIKVQDTLSSIAEHQPTRVHHQDGNLLVGVAGLLTSECKVWWSQPFELEANQ